MCIRKICPLISISFLFSLLLLTGCSHVAGNVIPEGGLTMESIYDDAVDHDSASSVINSSASTVSLPGVDKTHSFAESQVTQKLSSSNLSASVGAVNFSKLPNPELKLYVFPHLAGSKMLPVPGYWTAFPAYPRDYYALPLSPNEGGK